MNEQIRLVAQRIHELREISGFDINTMADMLHISPEQYEQYESLGTDIPISVLYQLASIYQVDMTELLSGKSPRLNAICVVRKGEGLNVERYSGYQYENIGYKFMHRKMEPLIVTLNPSSDKPSMVTHGGQEINFCLKGQMILYYDGREVVLGPGDCAYFDPAKPHGQKAASDQVAKFLTIINE